MEKSIHTWQHAAFCRTLRDARREAGLTQTQLARTPPGDPELGKQDRARRGSAGHGPGIHCLPRPRHLPGGIRQARRDSGYDRGPGPRRPLSLSRRCHSSTTDLHTVVYRTRRIPANHESGASVRSGWSGLVGGGQFFNLLHEARCWFLKRPCERDDGAQRGGFEATLDEADVGAVRAALESQLLLRKLRLKAQGSHDPAEGGVQGSPLWFHSGILAAIPVAFYIQ